MLCISGVPLFFLIAFYALVAAHPVTASVAYTGCKKIHWWGSNCELISEGVEVYIFVCSLSHNADVISTGLRSALVVCMCVLLSRPPACVVIVEY